MRWASDLTGDGARCRSSRNLFCIIWDGARGASGAGVCTAGVGVWEGVAGRTSFVLMRSIDLEGAAVIGGLIGISRIFSWMAEGGRELNGGGTGRG